MKKKYKLTDETISIVRNGIEITLYRIQALKKLAIVKAGDKGGFVENESNLSQKGNCWIYDDAKVYDDAQITGNASVWFKAEVYDLAHIYGNASIYEDAKVHGNAKIHDNANIYDNAEVYGTAEVCGNAEVYEYAKVYGDLLSYDFCGKKQAPVSL